LRKPLVGILIHPWDIQDEGIGGVAETLSGLGISTAFIALNATGDHHPPQPVDARLTHNPRRKRYVSEDGRFYYEVDGAFYPNSMVTPKRTSEPNLMGFDVLAEPRDIFAKNGVDSYGWLSSFHNGQLVEEAHELAVVDIIGEADRNWMCPNNPNTTIILLETINEIQAKSDLKGLLLDHASASIAGGRWSPLGSTTDCC
jgi:hypothetical protein